MSAYMDEAEWTRSICRGYADRIAELERENTALLRDKERLDWLEKSQKLWEGKNWLRGPDFITRAAIDAARTKDTQP